MSKQLKAIFILAAMVALIIIADNLISRKPDIDLAFLRNLHWSWRLTLPLILAIVACAVLWAMYSMFGRPGFIAKWIMDAIFGKGVIKKFGDDLGQIQSWVKLAERELLKMLADNFDQTGRQAKVRERAEWAAMANPEIFPTVFQVLKNPEKKDEKLIAVAEDPKNWSPAAQPLISDNRQLAVRPLPEEFGKLAEQAFDLNKTDMSNRGAAMGKIAWTAILLREVYQASYGRAKAKLEADLAAGGTPFVAPGLKELFGYGVKEETVDGKTVKRLIWSPPYDYVKLSLAMREGGFPKELFLKDKDGIHQGWAAIWKLTQQAPPPGWSEPEKSAPRSKLKLWFEYEQSCWEDDMTPS
jgi:hypothetical protein